MHLQFGFWLKKRLTDFGSLYLPRGRLRNFLGEINLPLTLSVTTDNYLFRNFELHGLVRDI